MWCDLFCPSASQGAFDFGAREAGASGWAWEEARMVVEVREAYPLVHPDFLRA